MTRIITMNELPEDVPEEYKSIKDTIWFIAVQSDWIGFGGIQYHKLYPYFGPTFVKPEFRGLGLQRALISARLNYCQRLKHKRVCTIVDYDNLASKTNVLRMGFHEVSRNNGEIYYECILGP